MAIIYRAQISPTKLELIGSWLPRQPWWSGAPDATLTNLGAYRFDDPDGRVGIETILVGDGSGAVTQIPVTYRDAPLPAAEASLMGTMEHTVLGRRWVYDAPGDPVYVATVVSTMVHRGTQAEELVVVDDHTEPRDPTASVVGSGWSPDAGVEADLDALTVVRLLDLPEAVLPEVTGPEELRLTGTWAGQATPVVLVTCRAVPR